MKKQLLLISRCFLFVAASYFPNIGSTQEFDLLRYLPAIMAAISVTDPNENLGVNAETANAALTAESLIKVPMIQRSVNGRPPPTWIPQSSTNYPNCNPCYGTLP